MKRGPLATLAPHQQLFVLGAAGITGLAIVLLLLVVPAHGRLEDARQGREQAQDTLRQVVELTERYKALRQSGTAVSAGMSLTAIVDETLQHHALQPASVQQNGANELSLRVDTESFDKALGWLSELENRPGILLRAINVRPLGDGRVSLNLTLQLP